MNGHTKKEILLNIMVSMPWIDILEPTLEKAREIYDDTDASEVVLAIFDMLDDNGKDFILNKAKDLYESNYYEPYEK